MEGEILFRYDIILNYEEHEILVLSTAAARNIKRIVICSAESRLLIVYIVDMTCCVLLTSSSLTNLSQQQTLLGCPISGVKNLSYIYLHVMPIVECVR